jgi:hypothetical protein
MITSAKKIAKESQIIAAKSCMFPELLKGRKIMQSIYFSIPVSNIDFTIKIKYIKWC